jgi:CRP-like cAMP-binding protein
MGLELFAGLSRQQLRQVVALSTLLHKAAGAVLAREGQCVREVLILTSGRAIATVEGKLVATLERGSNLGTSVLNERGRYGATVTTVTPTEVLVFSVADIRHLAHQHPTVRARLEATASALTIAVPVTRRVNLAIGQSPVGPPVRLRVEAPGAQRR